MIVNTVSLRLKRPLDEADREKLVGALREFAADPPFATGPGSVEENPMLLGDSPRAADVLLRVEFPDADAFRSYIVEERHEALVKEVIGPLCENLLAHQSSQ